MSIRKRQVGLDSFGRPIRASDPHDRIMQRTEWRGECLVYVGYRNRSGYGWARGHDGHNELAHRIVWRHHHPAEPMPPMVIHSCDNPACVTIAHLRGATHAENMADMRAKGRQAHPRGEKSGKARLTASQIQEIRRRYAAGETQRALGEEFGVSHAYLSRVVRMQRRQFDGLIADPVVNFERSL